MAANKKPPSQRQDNRPQRSANLISLPAAKEPEIPSMPPGRWRKPTVQVWEAFWRSAVAAGAMAEIDHVVLERYIVATDEWHSAMAGVRKQRLVAGSMGQPTLNPLAEWVKSREAEMRKCEEDLGIGLKKRAALGIEIGNAKLTARELNRMTEEERDDNLVEIVDEEEAQLLADFE